MKRKVYTDGNGGSSVLIEGLGAYVPKVELEALKAQLEALLEPAKEAAEALGFASHHLRGRASENMLMDMAEKADALISAIGSTPAQCLAEIKAQAVETEYEDLLHVVANQYDGNDSTEWSIGANHVFKLFAKEIWKRSETLSQRAKVGE